MTDTVEQQEYVTWPDGSVSSRDVYINDRVGVIQISYRSDNVLHRSDGGPACIYFTNREPHMVVWLVNGLRSNERLSAGLPTIWNQRRFSWESNRDSLHNINGPVKLLEGCIPKYCLNDQKVSREEFEKAYLVAHLKEYEEDPELYDKLFDEMMTWAHAELATIPQ